jgi:acyl carrier protein
VPHSNLGEDVAAAVIASDPSLDEASLRKFADARLAFFKVPSRILFLEEIPKGPTGKLQRIGLAEKLGLADQREEIPSQEIDHVPPGNPIEELVHGIWSEVLNIDQISIHHRFLHLGGDSLLALQLVSRIRESLDLEISLLEFFDAPTIADQASIIQNLLLQNLDEDCELKT